MKAAKPANMATPISQCGMSIFAPCPPRHTASTVVHDPNQMKEPQMGKLAIGLAGALMLVSVAFTAQAQTQGAVSIHAQAQNATIIHKTACAGFGAGARRACAASAAPPVAGARPVSQRIAAFAMSRSEAARIAAGALPAGNFLPIATICREATQGALSGPFLPSALLMRFSAVLISCLQ
jgi:hypothetical protein